MITTGPTADYIQALRNRNYSPTTTYARERAIIRFRRATGRDPLETDADQMIGWWTNLRLSPSSRAGELAAIRGYCKWAVKHGLIETDPTRLLDRPRLPRRVPRPAEECTLTLALASAPADVSLILCCAAYGGLRAGEVSALEWPDIHHESILIHGKGNKERLVPMHPMIRTALDRIKGKHRGPVLLRRDGHGGRVPPHLVSQWANSYLHGLGIVETLHQYRHRYASQIFRLSKDIRLTQELLGHASIISTAGYAAWDKSVAALVTARLP